MFISLWYGVLVGKATVPLSAFLRGPTHGTISEAFFEEVCPPSEIVHINLVATS